MDKIVEYGFVVLIGGIVVKKVGLFVMFGIVLFKFWKVIVIGVVVVGVFVRKLFLCKKD